MYRKRNRNFIENKLIKVKKYQKWSKENSKKTKKFNQIKFSIISSREKQPRLGIIYKKNEKKQKNYILIL